MKTKLFLFLHMTVHSLLYAQWAPVNTGLLTNDIYALTACGTNLFAGTMSSGIFLSTDNGANWTAANVGLTNTNVRSFTAIGTFVFAGTLGGVFLSTTDGASWASASSGLTSSSVYALAASGSILFAGTSGGVFRSMNNGGSWTAVNSGLTTTTVNALGVSGTTIFVGTDGGGVFRSTNNGGNWTQVNTGLANLFVVSFCTNGSNLFAGTWSGVNRSVNNGTNWTAANNGLPSFSNVRSLIVSGANMFAGIFGQGIFRSSDNGANWISANNGLTNATVRSLAICGANIFAGTSDGGVFSRAIVDILPVQLSMFTAQPLPPQRVRLHWATSSEVNNYGFEVQKSAPPLLQYQTIPHSFVPGHGTTNEPQQYMWVDSVVTSGIWYYRLKQIDLDGATHYSEPVRVHVPTSVTRDEVLPSFSLAQNFPNPWNPSTTIRYTVTKKSNVVLSVFNSVGEQVLQLVNQVQAPGAYSAVLRGDGLASGVYYYRLQAGEYVATRKLVLMR